MSMYMATGMSWQVDAYILNVPMLYVDRRAERSTENTNKNRQEKGTLGED